MSAATEGSVAAAAVSSSEAEPALVSSSRSPPCYISAECRILCTAPDTTILIRTHCEVTNGIA